MKTETPQTESVPAVVQPPLVRRYSWEITKIRTGETCRYNSSSFGPVDAIHVERSPYVQQWANGEPIKIHPPNAKSPDAGEKGKSYE
jgi:hypothetical protein